MMEAYTCDCGLRVEGGHACPDPTCPGLLPYEDEAPPRDEEEAWAETYVRGMSPDARATFSHSGWKDRVAGALEENSPHLEVQVVLDAIWDEVQRLWRQVGNE